MTDILVPMEEEEDVEVAEDAGLLSGAQPVDAVPVPRDTGDVRKRARQEDLLLQPVVRLVRPRPEAEPRRSPYSGFLRSDARRQRYVQGTLFAQT